MNDLITAGDKLSNKRRQLNQIVRNTAPGHVPPVILISEVMTPSPWCIAADTTLLSLVRMFHHRQFRHLLVTDKSDRLMGVISDRDVIRRFPPGESPDEQLLDGVLAADVMSTDVLSISSDRPIEDALEIMLDFGIHCLPVVDDERLVGIMTSTDLYAILQVLLPPVNSERQAESELSAACGPQG